MTAAAEPAEEAPPPRYLLRPAGVLVQLSSAACLLLGTIAFVLVQQNKSGGAGYVIAWAIAAMAGLVFGGLMSRGGLVSVIAGALLAGTFGVVLLVIDYDTLRGILRLLPDSDVEMIADVLVGAAIGMVAASALSLASIPQARRYGRALREAEDAYDAEVAAGGDPGASASMARAMPIATSRPAPADAGYVPSLVTPASDTSGQLTAPRPQIGASWNVGAAAPHIESATAPVPTRPGLPFVPAGGAPPGPEPAPVPAADVYIPSSASTARGWTPSPARTHTTMMIVRPRAEAARSRRRVYFALGGVAIGVGVGLGVILSSSSGVRETAPGVTLAAGSGGASGSSGAAGADGSARSGSGAGSQVAAAAGSGSGAGAGSSSAVEVPEPNVPIRTFLDEQREAIAKADAKALAATVIPSVIGFGINADDVFEGRLAFEAMALEHLAETPPDGFAVTSRFLTIGEEKNHAWVAEELEVAGGGASRRIAITQLLTFQDGAWKAVAVHWAVPVPDEAAERRAILGTLPRPDQVPNQADGGGDLDKAVRAAFASREAFAATRSERADGFNFGSGPNERVVGGGKIKRLFGRLRSELRPNGGVRTVAGSSWDPTQQANAWIGVATLNVDYTHKSRAATDLTQTFRVLAVMIREGDAWKIVQTQFSHGG